MYVINWQSVYEGTEKLITIIYIQRHAHTCMIVFGSRVMKTQYSLTDLCIWMETGNRLENKNPHESP